MKPVRTMGMLTLCKETSFLRELKEATLTLISIYVFCNTIHLFYSLLWNCLLLRQVTLVDEEGCVLIKWVDRTVSKVKPQELYKVDTEVTSLPELRSL